MASGSHSSPPHAPRSPPAQPPPINPCFVYQVTGMSEQSVKVCAYTATGHMTSSLGMPARACWKCGGKGALNGTHKYAVVLGSPMVCHVARVGKCVADCPEAVAEEVVAGDGLLGAWVEVGPPMCQGREVAAGGRQAGGRGTSRVA